MYEYKVIEIRCDPSNFAKTLGKRINKMAAEGWRYRGTAHVSPGDFATKTKAIIIFERKKK